MTTNPRYLGRFDGFQMTKDRGKPVYEVESHPDEAYLMDGIYYVGPIVYGQLIHILKSARELPGG